MDGFKRNWPDFTLLRHAPILVWRADQDGLCDWFNQTWLDYTGRTIDQERGNGWTEGVHPDDFERCLDIYLDAFGRREPFNMEYRLRTASGEYGWIVDYGEPIFSPDFLGYVGYCFDITERRRFEAALVERDNALLASNAELEQFAYVVSHDLREPIRMVSSYLGLLEKRYGHLFDADGVEFLSFAKEGAQRMDVMVRDILAYSQIDQHDDGLKPMRLVDGARQALAVLGKSIDESKALVDIDLDDSMIAGDQSQIERLFRNLIGNAIKYCRPGQIPRVKVLSTRQDDSVTISVEDDGIGIAPDAFETVFLLFQRLGNRRDYEGSGIGLAACKKIVERHQGRIWVEAVPTGGSIFSFTLPLLAGKA